MKADLDLDQALEISLGMEAASQKAKELKGTHCTQPVIAVFPVVVTVGVGITIKVNVNFIRVGRRAMSLQCVDQRFHHKSVCQYLRVDQNPQTMLGLLLTLALIVLIVQVMLLLSLMGPQKPCLW